MRILRGKIGSIHHIKKDVCLTIGNFDGVHLGHQALIKETKQKDMFSMVMTFNPHPLTVCKREASYHFLTPLSYKIDLIRILNPDYLFIVDFDILGASRTKEFFVEWLHKLNVKKIVCGRDCHFGHMAQGNISDLKKEFEVIELPNVIEEGERVSSTRIKSCLEQGKIIEANHLLGRPYSILGLVIHGSQIGTNLGFPTANIDIFGNTIPKKGVYAVMVDVKNHHYFGMANVGNNPTINYQLNARLEVHLFDFCNNLYGETVNVHFLEFFRPEIRFEGDTELIEQLHKDCKQIKVWVKENQKAIS